MEYKYTTIKVTRPAPFVLQAELNRPRKLNAWSRAMWRECRELFDRAAGDPDVRAIVVTGSGKIFTAGIDLNDHAEMFGGGSNDGRDAARKAFALRANVAAYQDSFTAAERCPKPVIAAVHSACIGAGVDLITACDIRVCTRDAYFCVKEVDVGLCADVGTLQRLPKVIGNQSLVRDLCLTSRKCFAEEAKSCGLVSRIYSDKAALLKGALALAKLIAAKSPVAVQGTKITLNHARDNSVREGLEFVKNWNMAMLSTEDIPKSVMGAATKTKPIYSKL